MGNSKDEKNQNSKLFFLMWILLFLIFLARKFQLPSISVLLSIAFFIVLLLALNDRRKAILKEEESNTSKNNSEKR